MPPEISHLSWVSQSIFLVAMSTQSDVVVAVAGVRGNQQALIVRAEVIGGKQLFALMRRQQSAFPGRLFSNEDVGIGALCLLLCIGDPLAIP